VSKVVQQLPRWIEGSIIESPTYCKWRCGLPCWRQRNGWYLPITRIGWNRGVPTFGHSREHQKVLMRIIQGKGPTVNSSWEQNASTPGSFKIPPREISFKGGSHLVSQTHFLSSLSKSWDEISLRVVVCNDPGFYQFLGEIFRFCFAWDDWIFTGI
jgi:hypothetical protein